MGEDHQGLLRRTDAPCLSGQVQLPDEGTGDGIKHMR